MRALKREIIASRERTGEQAERHSRGLTFLADDPRAEVRIHSPPAESLPERRGALIVNRSACTEVNLRRGFVRLGVGLAAGFQGQGDPFGTGIFRMIEDARCRRGRLPSVAVRAHGRPLDAEEKERRRDGGNISTPLSLAHGAA